MQLSLRHKDSQQADFFGPFWTDTPAIRFEGRLVETHYYPNNDDQTFKYQETAIWQTQRGKEDVGMILVKQQISWPHVQFKRVC